MTLIKWAKIEAGRYSAVSDAVVYLVCKHDGLTWQDPAYWCINVNGKTLTRDSGWYVKFRTLADAKAWVAEQVAGRAR